MSASFRRRAERFQRLLENPGAGIVRDADLVELATLANAITRIEAPAPSPEFSRTLRDRLMNAAVVEFATSGSAGPATDERTSARLTVRRRAGSRRAQRRATALTAVFAILGASAGTALASQGSLPGDTLYPVKRAIENLHNGFVIGDADKGGVMLSEASTRLTEASELAQREAGADEIAKALTTFDEQAQEASDLLIAAYKKDRDPADLTKLRNFTATSMQRLEAMSDLVPAAAKAALTQAAATVAGIDRAAADLCNACGTGVATLPPSLVDAAASTIVTVGPKLPNAHPPTKKGGSTQKSAPAAPLPSASARPSTKASSSSTAEPGASKAASGKASSSAATDPVAPIASLVTGLTGVVGGVLGGVLGLLTGSTPSG